MEPSRGFVYQRTLVHQHYTTHPLPLPTISGILVLNSRACTKAIPTVTLAKDAPVTTPVT